MESEERSMLEKKVAKAAKATAKEKAEAARKPKAPTTTKRVSPSVAAPSAIFAGSQDVLHERVRRRAYELWESEGRPSGREHDHWLQAEREVAGTPRQHAA
jgi:Protein of unknown function (DUF2934)